MLSLNCLLDPEVLADPYPLYGRLRREAPVHWDPHLDAWVVTRYSDVVDVLQDFSAERTPSRSQHDPVGIGELSPIARVMGRQMLFLDPPSHTRVRMLAARAFTPRRVEVLRGHIQDITDSLLDHVERRGATGGRGRMDAIADLAVPLPAMVTAETLGVPRDDWRKLRGWSTDFARLLGTLQHDPGTATRALQSMEEMTAYFQQAVRQQADQPTEGLVNALAHAEVDGDRFSEEEVVANLISTLVGALEPTTHLIGNGLLSLLRNPLEMGRLRADPSLIASAVEELLRYESPKQYITRVAPGDVEVGGKLIRERQAVVAVIGAANRDPARFPEPDRLDLARKENRHVAFGWGGHFCFGAPLARMVGKIALSTVLRRLPKLRHEAQPPVWREQFGLRGLKALPITF